jgi:hypothetical protein
VGVGTFRRGQNPPHSGVGDRRAGRTSIEERDSSLRRFWSEGPRPTFLHHLPPGRFTDRGRKESLIRHRTTNGLPSLPLRNRKTDAMRLFSPRTIYERFEFETLLGLEA